MRTLRFIFMQLKAGIVFQKMSGLNSMFKSKRKTLFFTSANDKRKYFIYSLFFLCSSLDVLVVFCDRTVFFFLQSLWNCEALGITLCMNCIFQINLLTEAVRSEFSLMIVSYGASKLQKISGFRQKLRIQIEITCIISISIFILDHFCTRRICEKAKWLQSALLLTLRVRITFLQLVVSSLWFLSSFFVSPQDLQIALVDLITSIQNRTSSTKDIRSKERRESSH